MKTGLQQDYPASLDRLWQVLGQPDYPHSKYRALGVTAYRIHRFEADRERIELDFERTFAIPADKVPALAQRFLPSEQTLRYLSHWRRSGSDCADFDVGIQAPGLPLQVSGQGHLQQIGPDNSRLSIDFTINAHVPLLGSRIEQMIAAQIEKSFRDDHDFTLRYLAEAP